MTDLRITGWAKDAVRAFAHIMEDDNDAARDIVKTMSPRDRAVLSFALRELSEIVDDEELSRRAEDRRRVRRAREAAWGGPGQVDD